MVGFGRTAKSVHQTKALREIFRMGMVSGVLVLMGAAKLGFFMIVDPFFWTDFLTRSKCHENAKWTCSDFGFSG